MELTETMQGRVAALEALSRAHGGDDSAGITPVEHFADGLYSRQITIPEGVLIVGGLHKKGCVNIIVKGRVRIATDEAVVNYEGPCTFVSHAGVKRAALAITETTWITVHATDVTDPAKIWDDLIVPVEENK